MGHSTNYLTEVHYIHRAIESLRPYILLLDYEEKLEEVMRLVETPGPFQYAWSHGKGNTHLYFSQGKEIYLQSSKENLYGCEWPETVWFQPGGRLTLITWYFSMGYQCLQKKANGYRCLSAIYIDNLSFKW